MRGLIEILIVICFCMFNFGRIYPMEQAPVFVMVSLCVAIGIELLRRLQSAAKWQALLCALYFLMMIWRVEFALFLPLVLYFAYFNLHEKALIMLLPMFFTWRGMDFLIVGLSLYLSYRNREFHRYVKSKDKMSYQLMEDVISLEKYNAKLLENEANSAEIARLEERNRIAGQLHDSLGHTISSSILQLEALKIIENEPFKKDKLQLLQDTLSNGMNDIRKQLHGIYDNSFSLHRKLEELAAGAPDLTIRIENQLQHTLNFEQKRDVYNIVREALTNTMKHSEAQEFSVFMKEQGENMVLLISDDGKNPPKNMSMGLGLSGVEDIVAKYHGKMNFYFRNGFHIHILFMEVFDKSSPIPPNKSATTS